MWYWYAVAWAVGFGCGYFVCALDQDDALEAKYGPPGSGTPREPGSTEEPRAE